MKKLMASGVFMGFLILSAFAWASELRVIAPFFGEVDFGSVHTQIISSPFGQREGACPQDGEKRKECEGIFLRKWFRITPQKQPRIMISVNNISRPSSFVPDYSLYVARYARSGQLGGLFIGEKRISFSYYTINADAAESENIEKHRPWLDAMARQKKKIFLSGRIVRIETSDLALFEEGKTETEFLDFYLSDIKFEK